MTKEMRKHLETVIESIIFPNEQAGKAAFHEYCNLKSQAILLGESDDEDEKDEKSEDENDEKSEDKDDKKSDKEDEKSEDKDDKKSDKAPPFVKKNKKDEGDEE